ncbi:MAG: hypothetical protein GXY76_08770 [Chloroflexi bacterium]|nr:hypothetical protein [Chloroflexota bacterium]
MRLFTELNIETQSTCNRACPTCMRNSWPDRAALVERFEIHQMPGELVHSLLDQAAAMGYGGQVCLQHFNEPLQDGRLAEFGRYAKGKGFAHVYANTNGDLLTPELAAELDGALDRLHIALYGPNKLERSVRYRGWFAQTRLTFTDGSHVITHHSPYANLAACVAAARPQPCEREAQMRCIIGYTGQMYLCCDDILGQFGLGNAHDMSLEELWFGEKHQAVVEALRQPGGREQYELCRLCPRQNTPYGREQP